METYSLLNQWFRFQSTAERTMFFNEIEDYARQHALRLHIPDLAYFHSVMIKAFCTSFENVPCIGFDFETKYTEKCQNNYPNWVYYFKAKISNGPSNLKEAGEYFKAFKDKKENNNMELVNKAKDEEVKKLIATRDKTIDEVKDSSVFNKCLHAASQEFNKYLLPNELKEFELKLEQFNDAHCVLLQKERRQIASIEERYYAELRKLDQKYEELTALLALTETYEQQIELLRDFKILKHYK